MGLRGHVAILVLIALTSNAWATNVIIFSLDSVPATYTHLYGYGVENTPNLDEFARGAVVFDNAISCAPWTVPSHRCLLTSLYPSQHGLVNFWRSWSEKVQLKIADRPDIVSLEGACEAAGHRTGAFTGDAGVTPSVQDFQVHYDADRFGTLGSSEEHALAWLDEVGDRPFCALFHGYIAHGQSKLADIEDRSAEQASVREAVMKWIAGNGPAVHLSADELQGWRSWYDAKIRSADADFGRFIAELRRRGLYEGSVIVVVSDHGTDVYDHGYRLDDLLLRIVMAIRFPSSFALGLRVKGQVSNVDVMSTVLSLAGIPEPSNQMMGRKVINPEPSERVQGHDVFPETDFGNRVHLRGHWRADGTHAVNDLGRWGECLPVYPGQCER